MMFESVSESVWGKNLQEKFLRGVPGDDRETPGCIVWE
jgi:hypothetical protein